MDGWKSPLCFSSVGILCASGLPLSLTRLLFWHALYRPKLELRVNRQRKCVLWDHPFKYMRGYEQRFYLPWPFNSVDERKPSKPSFVSKRLRWSRNPAEWSVLFQRHAHRYFFPSGHEGEAVSSRDTESHCEVRTTSDMKLSTACQQDVLTLCPSASSLLFPWMERLSHCTTPLSQNTCCHNLGCAVNTLTGNPKEMGKTHDK